MQPIEVVWWGGQRGSWCQCIVEFLTEGMTHRMDISELQGDGAIVVVKADQLKDLTEVNAATGHLKWTILFITANEEGNLWIDKPDTEVPWRIWLQTPHKHQTAHHYLPWGWSPGCATEVLPKLWDWSFAGQITHSRREEFLKVARTMDDRQRMLVTSKGFSQGIPQEMYYKMLAGTKVAPCPSGPITVDSMRVCEALQLGAVPVIDGVSPTGPYPEYWERVFGPYTLGGGPCPLFCMVDDWNAFPKVLDRILSDWKYQSAMVEFWWGQFKINIKEALLRDLHDLGAL